MLDWLGVRPGAAARPVVLSGQFDSHERSHRLEISVDARIARGFGRPGSGHAVSPPGIPFPAVLRTGNHARGPGSAAGSRWPMDRAPDVLEIPAARPPESSWLVQAGLFVDDRPYGAPALLEISGHAAVGGGLTFVHPPSDRYPGGGPAGLVNGLHGSRFFRDGLWSGFEGHDLDATARPGSDPGTCTGLSVRFLQDANAWIFLPREVRFLVSADGTNLERGRLGHPRGFGQGAGQADSRIRLDLPRGPEPVPSGSTRISPGICPDWHPGHGEALLDFRRRDRVPLILSRSDLAIRSEIDEFREALSDSLESPPQPRRTSCTTDAPDPAPTARWSSTRSG